MAPSAGIQQAVLLHTALLKEFKEDEQKNTSLVYDSSYFPLKTDLNLQQFL